MYAEIFVLKVQSKPKKADDIFATFQDDDEFHELPNFHLELFASNTSAVNTQESEEPIPTSDSLHDARIGDFIEQNKNTNTARKTKTDLNVWKRWCSSVDEERNLEDIPPMQLDRLLCHFFITVRKQDGTEFEPSTLMSFQRSFGRHLCDLGKPYCLFNDKEFAKSRATLESKRKQLRQQGKGRCPNKALRLNEDEMEKL